MDDQLENAFEERKRHRMSSHIEWTEALRVAIALPLLFVACFSALGQSLQPGHLPSTKQVAPMTPEEEKNLAFVLDWWREVIEARHTETWRDLRSRGLHPAQSQYSYWSSRFDDVLQEPRTCDRADSRAT